MTSLQRAGICASRAAITGCCPPSSHRRAQWSTATAVCYRGTGGTTATAGPFINGEAEIGYTIHRVDSTLDGGPIIYQQRIPVKDDAVFGELKTELMDDLVERLPKIFRGYLDGALLERSQDIREATFVGRRQLRDCYIEWTQSSEHIERFVRALLPPAAPGAFTVFRDKKLIILSAQLYETAPYHEIPGHVVYRLEDRGILVKMGDGVLLVKEVDYEGERLGALDLFATTGYWLGVDLVGDRLKSLGHRLTARRVRPRRLSPMARHEARHRSDDAVPPDLQPRLRAAVCRPRTRPPRRRRSSSTRRKRVKLAVDMLIGLSAAQSRGVSRCDRMPRGRRLGRASVVQVALAESPSSVGRR